MGGEPWTELIWRDSPPMMVYRLGSDSHEELIYYTDCMPDPRCTASASDQNVQKNVMVFGPMTDVGVSKKGRRRGSLDINQLYALAL